MDHASRNFILGGGGGGGSSWITHLGISSWGGGGGGELMDHVHSEGKVDSIIVIIDNILGGKLGQFGGGGGGGGGGGKLPLRPPP